MTVRVPNDEDKRRAELIAQGIWPGPPSEKQVGAKGLAEAKKRFTSQKGK